jgi:hypothetical protein
LWRARDLQIIEGRVPPPDNEYRPMTDKQPQDDVTLLDLLIAGFEQNDIWEGYHWRRLPLADAAAAVRKFNALVEEARRWRGPALRSAVRDGRRLAAWDDLELRQAGRAILLRVRAPQVANWWHDKATWAGEPLGPIYDWLEEEKQNENSARPVKPDAPLRG